MDIHELKKQSDLSYNTAVAKRNALEKAHSRQVMAYKEHLFRADALTISLVGTLKQHHDSFCVLDTNNNPVEIDSPDEFLTLLVNRNQESLAYNHIYKTFSEKGK